MKKIQLLLVFLYYLSSFAQEFKVEGKVTVTASEAVKKLIAEKAAKKTTDSLWNEVRILKAKEVWAGVKGDKGEQGIQGVPGKDGKDGTNTLTDAQLAEIISKIKVQPADLRGYPSLRSFGAIPDDGLDDYAAIQSAIFHYIKHKYSYLLFEKGQYDLSEGVVNLNPEGGYTFLSLHGDGNSFDPKAGGGTLIYLWDKKESSLYIQRGKGLTIKDFNFQGQNKIWDYTFEDIINERDNFNPYGCLDTRTAMHSAIEIDAFFNEGVPNKYPKKARYYTEKSIGGSTGIRVTDVYASYFIAGIAISRSGMQNGEDCKFTNVWIDHVKYVFTSGNAQNRTNVVTNLISWGTTLYVFDSYSTGYSGGCPFIVRGANIVACKYVFNTNQWFGNSEDADGMFLEEVWSLGGCINGGRDMNMFLTNMKWYVMGAAFHNGKALRLPTQYAQAHTIKMENCEMYFYGKPKTMMAFSATYLTLDHCTLDAPAFTYLGETEYIKTKVNVTGSPKRWNELPVIHTSSLPVAAVTKIEGDIWSFTTPDKFTVGEYVTIWKDNLKSDFNYGNPQAQGAGIITGITGNVVTVTGVPNHLKVGQAVDVSTYKLKTE